MRGFFLVGLIASIVSADSSPGPGSKSGRVLLDGYSPWYLAAHGGAVFFEGGDMNLYRVTPGQRPRLLLTHFDVGAFSVDDDYVYRNDKKGVWRTPWRRPGTEELVTAHAGPVAVDSENVYVGTPGALLVFPKHGGAARSLPAPITRECDALAAGEGWVYAADDATVVAIPKAGGASRRIVEAGIGSIRALASDGHDVYFLADDGWIWRAPGDQHTPPTRWMEPPFPGDVRPPKSLAADARGVYTSFFEQRNPSYDGEGDCHSPWIDVDGQIVRLPK